MVEEALAFGPRACGSARHLVGATLEHTSLQQMGNVAELLVSELVSNVVRHASGPMRLRLLGSPPRALRVEVDDCSEKAPVVLPLSPDAFSGRGMALVDSLASDWGVVRHAGHGKTVWFELGTGAPD